MVLKSTVWVPDSSFSDVFFYLSANRGNLRLVQSLPPSQQAPSTRSIAANTTASILVHPLTSDQRGDHETRNAWMGTPWPIFLDGLPAEGEIPLQYPELGLGWSTSPKQEISLEERRKKGAEVEALLANDPEAAPAPKD